MEISAFSAHAHNYPPFIARKEISKYFPWLKPRTMKNKDCEGCGPEGAIRQGREVVYETRALLKWLDQRSQIAGKPHRLMAETKQAKEDRSRQTKKGRKSKWQEVRERRGLI